MAINDFSSLIEVSATLSIAFVAVEYAKSFTKVLCERFFMYEKFIDDTFKKCNDILPDEETLGHIIPQNIDGRNTGIFIEGIKRERESLQGKLREESNIAKIAVTNACQTKSISSLSFFIFAFNILLLFLGGIENSFRNIVHIFVAISCFLSILYIVFGWIYGEKRSQLRYWNFQSLKFNTIIPIIIFILSLILTIALPNRISTIYLMQIVWKPLFLIWLSLSFLHYCIYALKIRNNAKELKGSILKKAKDFEKKCNEICESTNKLIAANDVSAMLNTY